MCKRTVGTTSQTHRQHIFQDCLNVYIFELPFCLYMILKSENGPFHIRLQVLNICTLSLRFQHFRPREYRRPC